MSATRAEIAFGAAVFLNRGVVPAVSADADLETAERPVTDPTVVRPAVVGQPMKASAVQVPPHEGAQRALAASGSVATPPPPPGALEVPGRLEPRGRTSGGTCGSVG